MPAPISCQVHSIVPVRAGSVQFCDGTLPHAGLSMPLRRRRRAGCPIGSRPSSGRGAAPQRLTLRSRGCKSRSPARGSEDGSDGEPRSFDGEDSYGEDGRCSAAWALAPALDAAEDERAAAHARLTAARGGDAAVRVVSKLTINAVRESRLHVRQHPCLPVTCALAEPSLEPAEAAREGWSCMGLMGNARLVQLEGMRQKLLAAEAQARWLHSDAELHLHVADEAESAYEAVRGAVANIDAFQVSLPGPPWLPLRWRACYTTC